MQKDVGTSAMHRMPVEYWLHALARLHNDAEKILEKNGVCIPPVCYRHVEEQEERFHQVRRMTDLKFDPKRLDEAICYLYESRLRTFIQGDTKDANLFGTHLLDWECSGKGHPATDLAMVFMQHGIPKEQWNDYLGKYLRARNVQSNFTQMQREFRKAMQYAATVVGYREIIGSSLRPTMPETIKDNQQLVFSLTDYA
jgi:thiamine kinase-like enzyme